MVRFRKAFLLVALAAAIGSLPFLAGCDAATTGTFELPIESVRFSFSVPANEFGSPVLSTGTVNVANIVQAANFTMADVVAVRITSRRRGPELEIRQPLLAGANHIGSASVRGSGGGPVLLSGSGFTGTDHRAPLAIQNADITNQALAGPMRMQLEVTSTSQTTASVYQLDVIFDIIIEVEG